MKAKRGKMGAVYLIVHSDIQYIVKGNDNKLKLSESLAEYNNHH
jgi:hypothetical protein